MRYWLSYNCPSRSVSCIQNTSVLGEIETKWYWCLNNLAAVHSHSTKSQRKSGTWEIKVTVLILILSSFNSRIRAERIRGPAVSLKIFKSKSWPLSSGCYTLDLNISLCISTSQTVKQFSGKSSNFCFHKDFSVTWIITLSLMQI